MNRKKFIFDLNGKINNELKKLKLILRLILVKVRIV